MCCYLSNILATTDQCNLNLIQSPKKECLLVIETLEYLCIGGIEKECSKEKKFQMLYNMCYKLKCGPLF